MRMPEHGKRELWIESAVSLRMSRAAPYMQPLPSVYEFVCELSNVASVVKHCEGLAD